MAQLENVESFVYEMCDIECVSSLLSILNTLNDTNITDGQVVRLDRSDCVSR